MKALRDVFGDTLVSLGKANPNVLVLDADLATQRRQINSPRRIRINFWRWG